MESGVNLLILSNNEIQFFIISYFLIFDIGKISEFLMISRFIKLHNVNYISLKID